MSSCVMNFKDSFVSSRKFYGQIIPTGHTFDDQCIGRLGRLHIAIAGSSKNVLYFTLRVFAALQS